MISKSSIYFEWCIYASEVQHKFMCYGQRRFCQVSLKVIIIVLNIEVKHHMDQLRSAIVKRIIKIYLSATGPILCPQPK